MTMTDGWVGQRVASDPTDVAALAVAPPAAASTVTTPASRSDARSDAKSDSTKPQNSSDDDASGSVAGKWVGRVALVGALLGGGIVGWPRVADLLANEPVAIATAPQGPPTQRLVLDGDTMYLEGSVPSEDASQQLEDVAADVVGSERVVNNFSISADAVFDPEQAVQLSVADTVLFSTGRADVSEQYEPLIDLAVELLQARELVTLAVIGHTDDVGQEETNLGLSIARAEATKALIVARGISADRITTEGRGESEPLESNETEDGRQANRRVEFLVTGMLR